MIIAHSPKIFSKSALIGSFMMEVKKQHGLQYLLQDLSMNVCHRCGHAISLSRNLQHSCHAMTVKQFYCTLEQSCN